MLLHRLTTEEPDDPLQLSEESQEYDGCTIVSDCTGYEESLVSREQVSNLDDVITLDSDDDSVDRGVARPGVMVGPLCDHYFAATWMKAIFHAIRQYSQNKIIHIILFKLKCIVTY